jgi:hypothetical protein
MHIELDTIREKIDELIAFRTGNNPSGYGDSLRDVIRNKNSNSSGGANGIGSITTIRDVIRRDVSIRDVINIRSKTSYSNISGGGNVTGSKTSNSSGGGNGSGNSSGNESGYTSNSLVTTGINKPNSTSGPKLRDLSALLGPNDGNLNS